MKEEIYKTDPNLSSDGVYRSVVRFLPNVRNTKQAIISKKFYILKPIKGEAFSVDFSNREDSIIGKYFWQLYKRDQEEAYKKFRSGIKYYSFVKVIEDSQRPELEGTIQIFEYGSFVKKIIDKQIENLFLKDFSLEVSLTSGFWDFTGCNFVDTKSPINAEETLILYEGVPDLENFGYKPWTEEQRQKVFLIWPEKLFSELDLHSSEILVG